MLSKRCRASYSCWLSGAVAAATDSFTASPTAVRRRALRSAPPRPSATPNRSSSSSSIAAGCAAFFGMRKEQRKLADVVQKGRDTYTVSVKRLRASWAEPNYAQPTSWEGNSWDSSGSW